MKPSTIATYSNKQFDYLEPTSDAIDIYDIAHGLSNNCRFSGQCRKFYSVAEHSILVSRLCQSGFALYGLLHDAAEAYTGDCPSPLKQLIPKWSDIEDDILRTVLLKYTKGPLPETILPRSVKNADEIALKIEMFVMMPSWIFDEQFGHCHTPQQRHIDMIKFLHPDEAERAFILRFRELTEGGE